MNAPVCPECKGKTFQLRGEGGDDLEFRLCPFVDRPGHMPRDEARKQLEELRAENRRFGRVVLAGIESPGVARIEAKGAAE